MQLLVEAIIAPGWLPSISKLNHTYWLLLDEIVCTERLVDICYLHVFENLSFTTNCLLQAEQLY